MHQWLYFRVYPGRPASPIVDGLIERGFQSVLDLVPFERWHFLRSLDADGLHMRWRLLPKGQVDDVLASQMATVLEDAVGVASEIRTVAYRPIVPVPPPDEWTTRQIRGVVSDAYRSDTDTFGQEGISAAERLFQCSSELAISVLQAESRGDLTRKSIVPLLMQETALALLADSSATESFWGRYADYWVGAGLWRGAERWKRRFHEHALSLIAKGHPILTSVEGASSVQQALLDKWRAALLLAREELSLNGDLDAGYLDRLAFHQTHLTNNRLGIPKMDEACIATIISHAMASVSPS